MKSQPGVLFFFGGTFDPPHPGHKAIVNELLRRFTNSVVLIVPAASAPLRNNAALFTYRQRFALLRQVFREEMRAGRVRLSALERRLPQPNYTFDTLAHLQKFCTQRPTIVIGADQAANIDRWHRAAELMRDYEFLVFSRRGAAPQFPAAMRYSLIPDFDNRHAATSIRQDLQRLEPQERMAAAARPFANAAE